MKSLALILIVAALAACDAYPNDPTAPETGLQAAIGAQTASADGGIVRTALVGVVHYRDVYWGYECDGVESELIAMEGEMRHTETLFQDGAGGTHYRAHANAQGLRGVGVESGDVYHAVEVRHTSYSGPVMGQHSSFVETIKLLGPDGRGFTHMASGHYSVNANGELVVEITQEGFACEL